jgi:redox-sensitive bicupin YhaK (pirin superfamily)
VPLVVIRIWLNLPAARKLAPADFKMLWQQQIPHISEAATPRSVPLHVHAAHSLPLATATRARSTHAARTLSDVSERAATGRRYDFDDCVGAQL